MNSKDIDERFTGVRQLRRGLNVLIDLVLGIALAYILALGAECPVADSITAGLVLMIVLMLIDIREMLDDSQA